MEALRIFSAKSSEEALLEDLPREEMSKANSR
jgi:hypothetical protein